MIRMNDDFLDAEMFEAFESGHQAGHDFFGVDPNAGWPTMEELWHAACADGWNNTISVYIWIEGFINGRTKAVSNNGFRLDEAESQAYSFGFDVGKANPELLGELRTVLDKKFDMSEREFNTHKASILDAFWEGLSGNWSKEG